MTKEEDNDCVEVIEIGVLAPLNIDLSALTLLEGPKRTTGNLATWKIML
jgi:hypothetical protein